MENNGVDTLIAALYDMVQGAKGIPLSSGKCVLDRDAVLDMLDDMSTQLPEDIKKSRAIVSSRNEIISQARKEAETTIVAAKAEGDGIVSRAKAESEAMIEHAKETAKKLVDKETVVQEANKQAKEIVENAQKQSNEMVNSAKKQAEELKRVSNAYMADSLKKTEDVIEASLRDVKETRAKFAALTEDKPNPDTKKSETKKNSPFVNLDLDLD